MPRRNNNSDCHLKQFGDCHDPLGFYRLLMEHVSWLASHNFSRATQINRSNYVRHFALWCIDGDLTLPATVTKAVLEAYQRYLFRHRKLDGKPLSWSSQHMHLREVRQFFAWLVKQQYLPSSPAAEMELPKQPKALPKAILSIDEVERILQQPNTTTPLGIRDRAILEVLYSTGIRRAEVCGLKLDDIHTDRQSLFVNQGKGQKDRYVPIGLRALLWVTRYVDEARESLVVDKHERTLFLTNDGTSIQPASLTEYGRRYIRAAGVTKPGSCHIFRHTMATLMHENGAGIRTIQAILGHAKLDTTQIYTQVSMRKLLNTHKNTHPAETGDKDDCHDDPGEAPRS